MWKVMGAVWGTILACVIVSVLTTISAMGSACLGFCLAGFGLLLGIIADKES